MIKCDICHFNNPDRFAYCGRCGNGLSNTGDISETFTNTTIEGERKQVTVIFADISGFTALNDAAKTPAEVERVLQIVNHCFDMLSEVVVQYDGYIDKYMGDAIMAVFGAPRNHEDDPERALRTALAMCQRLEDFNRNPPFPLAEPLGIHMGINTGTVIAGLIGTRRKRSYTVMGDAVNVASRLEDVSERGEILVSQDTFNLTNRLFLFKEREPVLVKGKKSALQIYQLIDARSQRASQRGISGLRAPMVGREKEIEATRRQIANLKQGQGGITVVVGEAGLGKSRLMSELAQETARDNPDVLWLEGRGLSFQQNLSYKLFIEILREYLGVNPDESSEVAWHRWQAVAEELFGNRQQEVVPYLATLMGIKLDEELTQNMPLSEPMILQQRMFMAVGEWVEAVATRRPLALTFEDLHWADANSVSLIEYLITVSRRLPLMLFCITRPDREVDFWSVRERAARDYPEIYVELNLEPLNQDQSRYLVDQLLRVEQLPDDLERLILSRSEGNPLFMEEVLRSLIEDEALVKEGDAWITARSVTEIDIPDTLAGVLTARIDRLDEPVKRTLQIASVIGRVFHRVVIEAVSDDIGDLDENLMALVMAELIRERSSNEGDREFIFKHVLIQETAYNNLLIQQRRIYHKKIADHLAQLYWLRGEEFASAAAHHYEQGEVWDRALTYNHRAAEAARNSFDNLTAVHFYTKALDIIHNLGEIDHKSLIDIYRGRGNLLKRLGKIEESRTDYERVLELAEEDQDQGTQMRALGELGKLHEGYEDFSQAAHYFERALKLARIVDDKPGLVDALNQLADFTFNMGDLSKTGPYLHEALRIAEKLGNKQRITSCQDGLSAVMLYQGEIAASVARFEELAQIWLNLGSYQELMRTYFYLATAYKLRADYHRSNRICQESLEILERFGDLNWVSQFRFLMAQNTLAQGDFAQTKANLTEMLHVVERLGKGIWRSMGLTQHGYFQLLLGQADQGWSEIRQGVELAESIGSPLWASRARVTLGLAERLRGNLAEAAAILEGEAQNTQRMGLAPDEVIALSELLETYVVAGDWQKLASSLPHLRELTTACDMRAYQAKTLWVSAQLARHQNDLNAALETLQQAKEIIADMGHRFLELAVDLSLVQIYRDQAQMALAESHLRQAEETFARIIGTIDDKTARRNFTKGALGKELRQAQKMLGRERV